MPKSQTEFKSQINYKSIFALSVVTVHPINGNNQYENNLQEILTLCRELAAF